MRFEAFIPEVQEMIQASLMHHCMNSYKFKKIQDMKPEDRRNQPVPKKSFYF